MQYINMLKIMLLCFSTAAMSQDYYVTHSGDDQANGLSAEPMGANGPFKTLIRAQQAIRDLKANGQFKEPVTIHIQTGTYQLQKPLDFDIRDSGFPDKNVHWQGENGPVVISGGIALKNCTQNDYKLWSCPTLDLYLDKIRYLQNYRKRGNAPGFELFINQQPMHLARWPNTDWAHIKIALNERTTFTSIEPIPLLDSDLSTSQVHILAGNDWHDQYVGISNIDRGENKITLASNTNYPLTSGRRYYLQNIKSELDAPNEWFYDKANHKIVFIAPDNYEPREIIVSYLENILNIKSSKYISFNNLTFQYSTDVAIRLDKTSNIIFNEIEANNIGGRAVEAKDSSSVSLVNSHIHHTGEGGILISGGDRITLAPANNLVHNNHFHDFGRVVMTYTPAIEAVGVGSKITHNLIEQSPGAGILLFGNDHLVEKNEIHHVCEQASDCGAIYSGRDWTYRGNIIRYNSIHDLFGYGMKNVDIANNKVTYIKPDGVRGVYLDDSVSGFSVIGNIFNNAGVMAIQLAGGRDNIIENNIINSNDYALWVDSRIPGAEIKKRLLEVPTESPIWIEKYPKLKLPRHNENWPEGNSLRRNIMISRGMNNLPLRYTMPEYGNVISNNIVWSETGSLIVSYNILDRLKQRDKASWLEWISEGIERDSMFANPCVSITGNKINFCAESPIKLIGFEPIPTDIGLIK